MVVSAVTFLVLFLFFVGGQSGCPSTCTCDNYSVLCISRNLESIPSFESLTIQPAIIDLSGNKLNFIDNDDFTFDNSYAVQEIYLNNSEILDIESDAFDDLENLQELYLGENLLNSIPEDLIQDLSDVILLDVSNNYFSGDLPKIKSKSLEVLALANSKITYIPDDALVELPNLKMLLLQQNSIKTINTNVFNHILERDSFFVRLSYNAWDCNCKTYELFYYLQSRNFIDGSEPYQCLNNRSEYEDIYDNNEGYVSKLNCPYAEINFEPIKKSLPTKEIINEKSFSLVKEDVKEEPEVSNDDEGNDEDKVETVFVVGGCKPNDIFEKSVNIFGLSINFVIFTIVIISFLLGALAGCVLNVAVSRSLKKKMQASESETKLMIEN